ncbi:MAG TPA: hypothetical protein VKG25_27410, partial [Bryobacteraceae bacterium]|nr:hypothetical protein [Bryobacteraceae bacterium]
GAMRTLSFVGNFKSPCDGADYRLVADSTGGIPAPFHRYPNMSDRDHERAFDSRASPVACAKPIEPTAGDKRGAGPGLLVQLSVTAAKS